MDRTAGPPRGVLPQIAPDGVTEHRRLLPCPALAAFVAHFWWVRWDLKRPFQAETLPHPSIHLVFERSAGEVVGVRSKRFTRILEGAGRVFGIKLRPGVFHPFARERLTDIASLRDRRVPVREVLGELGATLERSLEEVRDFEEGIARAEEHLTRALPGMPAEVASVRDLVELIAHDREILRVEDAARKMNLEVRTLERHFHRHVGVSPKWVIRRYRLIEAAEQLKAGHVRSLAALAADLGYFDQSHFVRDFRSLVGRTPSDLAAAKARE